MPPSDSERRLARLAPLSLLGLGALLLLPRLGRFGLWDPSEVRVADAARALLEPNAPPQTLHHPALTSWLVAAGFHSLGIGELGGRLPMAALSMFALLATYYAGRAFLRPRAALLGAVALATMPTFIFGARQLTSDAPLTLATALAVGGLARLVWPAARETILDRLGAAAAAIAGLFLGQLAAGALAGLVTPLGAIAIAIAFTPRRARSLVPGLLALGFLGAALLELRHRGVYGVWLGGVPRAPQYQTVVTTIVRALGFATVPWLAIAPFALLRALDGEQRTREDDDAAPDADRALYSRAVLVAWLALTYLAATLHSALVAEMLAPASAALGLLAGAYLDDAIDGEQRIIEGLAIGALVIVLGHDLLLTTDAFVSIHTSELIRWPQPLYWTGDVLFGVVAPFGLLVGLALLFPALRYATPAEIDAPTRKSSRVKLKLGAILVVAGTAILVGAIETYLHTHNLVMQIAAGVAAAACLAIVVGGGSVVWGVLQDPPLAGRARRWLFVAALAVQIVFALSLAQWFIPRASAHLSPKDLYGKTRQLDPDAPLGSYRFNATGAAYYMGGRTAAPLATLEGLLAFLRTPQRVFIFVGSDELASIDQAARGGTRPVASVTGPMPEPPPMVDYFVVDDANSHFLILSNRLGPGEKDLNPLRRFVATTPPPVKTPLLVSFEDKLQLIGYDLPDEVSRGADIRVRLFFKVLEPVGSSYKVFLHFDGPGQRVNGDHVPLDGRFPTQFWTAGTYVTDEFLLKPELATQPAGAYTLYFGLFAGDKRMKVKEGPSDGENRVKLGTVRVH